MRLFTTLCMFLTACAVTAMPLDIVGTWSLHNFQRIIREDNSCQYTFNMSETTGTSANDNATFCRIVIPTAPGTSDCTQVGFSDVLCEEAPRYHINGGWDAVLKFITLTVNNLDKGQNAYFSYTAAEMADGRVTPLKESAAHTIGTFGPPKERREEGVVVRRDEEAPGFTNEQWSLRRISREVGSSWSQHPNEVTITLEIVNGTTSLGTCQVQESATSETSPAQMSFAYSLCHPLGWYLSWGYIKEKDSVVATLIDPEKHKMAWFGWDWINNFTQLPDVGPSDVILISDGAVPGFAS